MVLLFENDFGKVLQSDTNRKIVVQTISFSFETCITNFMAICKQINQVDIRKMLLTPTDEYDYCTLVLTSSSSVLKLSIVEIIKMQELINGAKYILTIVDMCYRLGICFSDKEEITELTLQD